MFKNLAKFLAPGVSINITVANDSDDGRLIVSTIVKGKTDATRPMIIRASPEDLDEGYMDLLNSKKVLIDKKFAVNDQAFDEDIKEEKEIKAPDPKKTVSPLDRELDGIMKEIDASKEEQKLLQLRAKLTALEKKNKTSKRVKEMIRTCNDKILSCDEGLFTDPSASTEPETAEEEEKFDLEESENDPEPEPEAEAEPEVETKKEEETNPWED